MERFACVGNLESLEHLRDVATLAGERILRAVFPLRTWEALLLCLAHIALLLRDVMPVEVLVLYF